MFDKHTRKGITNTHLRSVTSHLSERDPLTLTAEELEVIVRLREFP